MNDVHEYEVHVSCEIWIPISCVIAHWLKVEPKQSTLFFNIHILLSTFKEDVEHVIETFNNEDVVAWQT